MTGDTGNPPSETAGSATPEPVAEAAPRARRTVAKKASARRTAPAATDGDGSAADGDGSAGAEPTPDRTEAAAQTGATTRARATKQTAATKRATAATKRATTPPEPGAAAATPTEDAGQVAPAGDGTKPVRARSTAKRAAAARPAKTAARKTAAARPPATTAEDPAAEKDPAAGTSPAATDLTAETQVGAASSPTATTGATTETQPTTTINPTTTISATEKPTTSPTAGKDLAATDRPGGQYPAAPRTPEVVARRVLDHPGFAPELLALAAVEGVGPRAREWADGLRSAYPGVGGDGLARLATRRYVRQAGAGGAAAALAGLFAPVAELAAVLWTQAGLVLHLAAAYDRDPAHPDRAVELLVLTQVHPDADSARAALAAARALDGPGEAPWPRVAEAAWRLAAPLAAQAGGWLALRLASRLLPGAAALAAAAGDAAATERLAARAVAAYRPSRAARLG